MEPSFDFWTVALTVAASQGVFLSVMILLRRSKANNLLATLILSFSICLYFYILYWTGYLVYFPFSTRLLGGMTFLMGPLMFFYLKSDRRNLYFRSLHFIPFVVYASLFFIVDVRSIASVLDIVQNLHLLTYSAIILLTISDNRTSIHSSKKLFKWKQQLAWSFLGYSLTFLLYYILVWTNQLQLAYDYAVSAASSIFIYYIGVRGFHKGEVLRHYESGRYHQALLPKKVGVSLLSKIKEHIQTYKPYLNSSLKLRDLADELGHSHHDVSQVINDLEGQSFTDFINSYRIEAAKYDLIHSEGKKIIHIAYDAGFNNKVTFNTAFKKHTGLSPSQFRASLTKVA